jgi:hypothetical protein
MIVDKKAFTVGFTAIFLMFLIVIIPQVSATVTLNSPADASTQYANAVTFSVTVNVTNPDYGVNGSLFTNETGSWAVKNFSTLQTFTRNYNLNFPTSGSLSKRMGVVFIPNRDTLITNVTKQSGDTATIAQLMFANETIISTATFSGDVATFPMNSTVKTGMTYYIVSYAGGSAYNGASLTTGLSYPYVGTDLNITKSIDFGFGGGIEGTRANTTTQMYNINSIGTYYPPSTKDYIISFTNTYLNGTAIKWNYKSCSNSTCEFAAANRTFKIDNTAPTIAIVNGNGTQNYGIVSVNHSINYTVTDTNLNYCQLQYNGSTRSIPCYGIGLDNISFAIQPNVYNATIYAVDAVGNIRSQNVNWTYKVFENSRSFNSSPYETSYETYSVNVTANSSLTAVTLDFNGTELAMTNTGSGVWSYARDLPTSSVGNNSVKYKFTYGGNFYSATSYQNVLGIIFTLCNATYATPFLNISFKDESSLAVINSTIPVSSFVYYLGTGSVNKTYSLVDNTAKQIYSICASPSTRNLYVDSYVQYSNTGYPQRIWNPSLVTYSNTTTSQVLYLLGTANGLYVTFQVINSADQVLSAVDVTANRDISGNDFNVGSGTTGADGTVTFWLNPDFTHDFSFSKTGFTTYQTSFAPSQSSYTITLDGGGAISYNNTFKGISYSVLPTNTYLINNTAYNFKFNVSSSYWDVSSYGFNLRLANGTIISGGSSSSAGTEITKSYNVNNQSIIYMDYYWVINGVYTNATKYWVIQNSQNTGWSIAHLFTRLNTYMGVGFFGIDNFARYLIVFLILFVAVGTMSFKYGLNSPMAISTLIFSVVFFFDVVVNLLPDIRGVSNLPTYISALILSLVIFKEAQQ